MENDFENVLHFVSTNLLMDLVLL